jgi:hypothetical protein
LAREGGAVPRKQQAGDSHGDLHADRDQGFG